MDTNRGWYLSCFCTCMIDSPHGWNRGDQHETGEIGFMWDSDHIYQREWTFCWFCSRCNLSFALCQLKVPDIDLPMLANISIWIVLNSMYGSITYDTPVIVGQVLNIDSVIIQLLIKTTCIYTFVHWFCRLGPLIYHIPTKKKETLQNQTPIFHLKQFMLAPNIQFLKWCA